MSLSPLEGGWSGETFLADDGAGERTVVRIYGKRSTWRGQDAAEVDAAVLRLVRGLLPVPEVLEVRRGDPDADQPPVLVTSFEPGVRGDLLLPTLDEEGQAQLGRRVGEVVAILGGMPMPRPGVFTDARLTITPFETFGLAPDLPSLLDGLHLPGLDEPQRSRLSSVADDAQALLDTLTRRCLVHSDLNPKNLLVDPGTLEVTAVLDWEFAHAGHPSTDLGNVLRFDRQPAYADAVVTAYVEARGGSREHVRDLARAADLWALLELAARSGENPVADRAWSLVAQIADTGDRHAWPPAW